MTPEQVIERWLRDLGAAGVSHPGGHLLAHLFRVHDLLGSWGARPALRLAGLCHALYGTDGFPVVLVRHELRGPLARIAGAETEHIVYRYASCDRAATYPGLSPFRDRFGGTAHAPSPAELRDFAELSAANELDLARHDPAFRTPQLRALIGGWRPHLSRAAVTAAGFTLGELGDHCE